MLQCYICHESIKRYEYTRHVAQHLTGNVAGAGPWTDPSFPVSRNDPFNYDHFAAALPAYSIPPRPAPRKPREHVDNHRQETPEGQSQSLNAFQIWRKDYAPNSPKYTTIDGGKRSSDWDVRQAAKVLRITTREEIVKIVKDFKGFSRNDDQRVCLELVQKTPIFPGLVAYTHTHLVMCPHRGQTHKHDIVSGLQQLIELWAKLEHTSCIVASDTLKDALLKILHTTKVESGAHKCNSALLNGAMIIQHDILNLASLAVICITGEEKHTMLGKPGSEIRKLIELFHNLLESNVDLEERYQRCFWNALIPFSKESQYFPHGFYIPKGAISELRWEAGGGFGQVSKGKLDSRFVAVKTLTSNTMSSLDYSKLISKEAIIWWYLSHPNCLPLHGIYEMPGEGEDMSFSLVSPWMDQGTLSDYLKRNPSANRLVLISDVVRGLKYLHTLEPHVAHRDIKPANILITKNGRACLADFGLASVFDTIGDFHTRASKAAMCGTLNYMAPEVLNADTSEKRRRVNKRACDMYSLGCTIFEVYTGKHFPFNERPKFPVDKISPDMWSFIESLTVHEPLKRLTAEMALDWMEEKAFQDGIDISLAPLDEEWERKRDANKFWSVAL